jgi:electron transfer DM13
MGRSFFAHPFRLAGALVMVVVLSAIVWYLASPLVVRTYRDEALPTVAPSVGGSIASSTQAPTGGPAEVRVLGSGELGYVDAIHNGTGPVRIVEVGGQRFLRFEDVMLTNAPDVHVYLSRETGGRWDEGTSLYVGALKATNGSFNYELTGATDVTTYRSVVVWCRAFRVLISWADLTAT